MDVTLKYRIVGASVLLSLAVIFIPMILDGSSQEIVTKMEIEIPSEPVLVFSQDIEQVELPRPREHVRNEVPDSVPIAPDLEKNIIPEVLVSEATPPTLLSWVVQVAAFGEEKKALALKDQLLNSGFDALIQAGKNGTRKYYRVKVGPVITREEAIKIRDRLRKESKFETAFVTRYPQLSN